MSDLEMIHGDSAEWDVDIIHPITKLPMSLDGTAIRFMAKKDYLDLDADAIIDVSLGSGVSILDSDGGKAHIKAPAGSTAVLDNERTKLVWDCQVTRGADGPWTVDRGNLIVYPEVVSS